MLGTRATIFMPADAPQTKLRGTEFWGAEIRRYDRLRDDRAAMTAQFAEQTGVEPDVAFVIGTFSKSLGGIGGFCASDAADFELLRLVSRAYMFTASLPPAMIASVSRALELIAAKPELRADLWRNAAALYQGLVAAGMPVGPAVSPIVSIEVQDPQVAVLMWNRLLALGLYVNLALPPATPSGRALLRTSVSAAHSIDEINFAVDTIIGAGVEFGIIDGARQLTAAQ